MVIDASALLAIFFEETHSAWLATELERNTQKLKMSTVNLTETLIRVRDRQPKMGDEIEARLIKSNIQFIAPDVATACIAASARLRFPLNLGDCFAYALAIQENCPILTIDKDFKILDCRVIMPPL